MSANVEVSDNFCGNSLVPGPSRNHVGVEPVDGILNFYSQFVIEWIGQLIQDVIGNLTVRWTMIFKVTQLSNAFVIIWFKFSFWFQNDRNQRITTNVWVRQVMISYLHLFNRLRSRQQSEIACVAGVKRGRRRGIWACESAWSRVLIPFPFPFERLPRRLVWNDMVRCKFRDLKTKPIIFW